MSSTLDASDRSAPAQPDSMGAWETIRWVLKPIASLRLTVVLFVACLVVVFCGTLAQREHGIQIVVQQYFRSALIWIPLRHLIFVSVPGSFPFPGGWLLGTLLLFNLIAAHITRFRFTWKRSGILLMHSGVLLLLLGELVTGLFAVEARMDILEGSSSNFVYLPSDAELAIIGPGTGENDRTVVIPKSLLKPGKRISHADLPFDVMVDKYYFNSRLVNPGIGNTQPQTHTQWAAATPLALPEVTGADPEQQIDAPSAMVSLLKKGSDEVLAKQTLSVWLERVSPPISRPFSYAGKPYDISLRFKRVYKPYTIHLSDFHHEKYLGTALPKDFKSEVRLVDPSRHEDRELAIWMNHPLRHAGETFYQADFRPDNQGTVLQVVRNPGWLMPYVACTLVSVGMLIHFGIILERFLRRIL
ncbi:MAG: cytochrome c biogenesis protein ResB [Planctomycetes bacterium]|nr:cytochrome c biogenesis protein ResB [Planctomycetota bacterium]